MGFPLSSCLPPRVRGGRGWRACLNSAGDYHRVLRGRKDLKEETKSFMWAGGVCM